MFNLHIHFGQVGPVGTVADPTKSSQRLVGQVTVPAGHEEIVSVWHELEASG